MAVYEQHRCPFCRRGTGWERSYPKIGAPLGPCPHCGRLVTIPETTEWALMTTSSKVGYVLVTIWSAVFWGMGGVLVTIPFRELWGWGAGWSDAEWLFTTWGICSVVLLPWLGFQFTLLLRASHVRMQDPDYRRRLRIRGLLRTDE